MVGFGAIMDNVNNADKEFLTISEAAKFLNVSVSTLRNWDKAGKLMLVRHPMNSYRLYCLDDLLKLKNMIQGNI